MAYSEDEVDLDLYRPLRSKGGYHLLKCLGIFFFPRLSSFCMLFPQSTFKTEPEASTNFPRVKHPNPTVVVGWALPALLCTLCRFAQAPYILRSGAKWSTAEASLMYTGSLSVRVRHFTAGLSKLLIHHHFCRRRSVLKWVSHKYQWLAV